MTTETLSRSFYKHDAYVATYYTIYIALEQWISRTLLRQDISRIFMASDEYAFRRRFELTDTSSDYSSIGTSSLHFPFANYWPASTGWKPDEREAAGSAALRITGLSESTRMLRALAVMTDISLTFHFDREDDARLAYETLLWHAYHEQLIYTTLAWKDEVLGIPLNIKIQDLSFNPDFKEKDWLEQNRMFPVKCRIELRSFVLQPPAQPIYLSDASVVDNERFTLTEEVLLYMRNGKKLFSTLSIDTLFNQNPSVQINQFGCAASTPTTARITWNIAADNITGIVLRMDGREDVLIAADKLQGEYTYRKLSEESTYVVSMEVLTTERSKQLAIQFSTPLSSASTKAKEAAKNTLVGTTW